MKLHYLLISGIICLSSCGQAQEETQSMEAPSDDSMAADSSAAEMPDDGDIPRAEPVQGETESFPDPNDTTFKK